MRLGTPTPHRAPPNENRDQAFRQWGLILVFVTALILVIMGVVFIFDR